MSVFIAISVVDTFALIKEWDTLLNEFILNKYWFGWSLTYYEAGCKLLNWINVTSQFCSSYFVLLFTLERLISVRFPLKRAVICTKRRISTAIISIIVVAALVSVYALYFFTRPFAGTTYLCH